MHLDTSPINRELLVLARTRSVSVFEKVITTSAHGVLGVDDGGQQ